MGKQSKTKDNQGFRQLGFNLILQNILIFKIHHLHANQL